MIAKLRTKVRYFVSASFFKHRYFPLNSCYGKDFGCLNSDLFLYTNSNLFSKQYTQDVYMR